MHIVPEKERRADLFEEEEADMTQQSVPFPGAPEVGTASAAAGAGAGLAGERKPTRTIAILARSASKTHRLAIQAKITSNGFSILSERLEEWTLDDQDFLHEFLRDEAADDDVADNEAPGAAEANEAAMARWIKRLTVGPIYVMVLERNRAAELWKDMMGPDYDEDDDAAVHSQAAQPTLDSDGLPIAKTGLRAQYGAGALYGSPPRSAERQLAICFPELASSEALDALHAEASMMADEQRTADRPGSVAAVGRDGSFVVREDEDIVYDEAGQAFDAHNGEPLELQSEIVIDRSNDTDASVQAKLAAMSITATGAEAGGNKVFRARPLPASTMKASAQPRLSRAAALRMGIKLPDPPKRTPSTDAASQDAAANVGISGLPRADVKLPRSLQRPSVAPRLNKAAAARTGASDTSPTATKTRKPVDFSSTPGHKRLSTSGPRPASLAAPTVAPRLNKAAAARQSQGGAGAVPPTTTTASSSSARASSHGSQASSESKGAALARKPVDFSNTPGHKRHSMVGASQLKSLQAPSVAPRLNKASAARQGAGATAPSAASSAAASAAASTSPSRTRAASAMSTSRASLSASTTTSSPATKERKPVDFSNTPGHKRASNSFSVASLQKPTIAPRSNAASARRLSVGGVGNNAAASTSPAKGGAPSSRPGSSLAGRPSSRISSSGPHQDGASQHLSQSQSRSAKAPPSSYRFP